MLLHKQNTATEQRLELLQLSTQMLQYSFPALVLPYKRVLLVSQDLVLSFTLDLM